MIRGSGAPVTGARRPRRDALARARAAGPHPRFPARRGVARPRRTARHSPRGVQHLPRAREGADRLVDRTPVLRGFRATDGALLWTVAPMGKDVGASSSGESASGRPRMNGWRRRSLTEHPCRARRHASCRSSGRRLWRPSPREPKRCSLASRSEALRPQGASRRPPMGSSRSRAKKRREGRSWISSILGYSAENQRESHELHPRAWASNHRYLTE